MEEKFCIRINFRKSDIETVKQKWENAHELSRCVCFSIFFNFACGDFYASKLFNRRASSLYHVLLFKISLKVFPYLQLGRAVAKVLTHRYLTAKVRTSSLASPYWVLWWIEEHWDSPSPNIPFIQCTIFILNSRITDDMWFPPLSPTPKCCLPTALDEACLQVTRYCSEVRPFS